MGGAWDRAQTARKWGWEFEPTLPDVHPVHPFSKWLPTRPCSRTTWGGVPITSLRLPQHLAQPHTQQVPTAGACGLGAKLQVRQDVP